MDTYLGRMGKVKRRLDVKSVERGSRGRLICPNMPRRVKKGTSSPSRIVSVDIDIMDSFKDWTSYILYSGILNAVVLVKIVSFLWYVDSLRL